MSHSPWHRSAIAAEGARFLVQCNQFGLAGLRRLPGEPGEEDLLDIPHPRRKTLGVQPDSHHIDRRLSNPHAMVELGVLLEAGGLIR